MHTDNEFIKTDVGRESSKAWQNSLPTKLIGQREPLLVNNVKLQVFFFLSFLMQVYENYNNRKHYLGLEILAKRPGGANRVIAQSVSAALE